MADHKHKAPGSHTDLQSLRDEADQGSLESMLSLASALELRGDSKEATKWLERAAKQGSQPARSKLIALYRPNTDNPKDNDVQTFVWWLEHAAKSGEVSAMLELNRIFTDGFHKFAPDIERATHWLITADSQGSTDASFLLAMRRLSGEGIQENRSVAIETLTKLAEQDYVEAMVVLAENYLEDGEIDRKNADDFFKWSNKAAISGDPRGMFYLSLSYLSGIGTAADVDQSIYWTREAAKKNEPRSMFNLSELYRNYPNLAPEPLAYIRLLEEAASLRNSRACLNLAYHYRYGLHVRKDNERALELLEFAASEGDPKAMFSLANAYRNDPELPSSDEKYSHWIQEAASLGHSSAIANLCAEYYQAAISDRSDTRLFNLSDTVAKNGNARAMYILGIAFRTGIGAPYIDWHQGNTWVERAANRGFAEAMWDIATVYRDGAGVEQDDALFFEWCLRAAQQNHYDATAALIGAYYNGHGVTRDLDACADWLQRAAPQGDRYAHIFVSLLELEKQELIEAKTLLEEAKPFFELQTETASIKREQLVEEAPNGVAHFTTSKALESILPDTSGSGGSVLRLYNSGYLNDPNEGQRLFNEPGNEGSELLRSFFPVRDLDEQPFTIPISDDEYSVYIGSLSKLSDSLDLWRAYGSDGEGFCLATPLEAFYQNDNPTSLNLIHKSILEEKGASGHDLNQAPIELRDQIEEARAREASLRPQVFNVAYTDEEVLSALFRFTPHLKEIQNFKEKFHDSRLANETVDNLVRTIVSDVLFLFKHQDYHSESEARILCAFKNSSPYVRRDTQHQPARLYVQTTPFLFSQNGSRIIIGPKVEDKRAAYLDLKYRLEQQGLGETTDVARSEISYR